jgi:hypothetical protein
MYLSILLHLYSICTQFIQSSHKQTSSFAREVNNIQIEKTVRNNGRMDKSNTQVATVENPNRGNANQIVFARVNEARNRDAGIIV